jgi:Helix-turn-helix domain
MVSKVEFQESYVNAIPLPKSRQSFGIGKLTWLSRYSRFHDVDEHTVRKPGHPRTVLRFAPVDGRLTLVNVEIGSDIGLRLDDDAHVDEPVELHAASTRLPLKKWTLEILEERARFAERLAAGEVLKQDPRVAEAAKKTFVPSTRADLAAYKRPPGRPAIPADQIADAARVYSNALADGLPPTKAVAEHFHISRSAAAKWIARARAAGELGKTKPRKAGGARRRI